MPAVYCNVHLPRVHTELGFYINGCGDLVRFESTFVRPFPLKRPFIMLASEYVPTYLQLGTQQALKAEMAKAPSTADVSGYIYAFEVLGTLSLWFLTGLLLKPSPLTSRLVRG